MKKSHKILLLTVLLILIAALLSFFLAYRTTSSSSLHPYFQYTQNDIASLKSLSTSASITKESLKKWDSIAIELIRKNKLGDIDASLIMTYVYVGQRDAAFLSYQAKGKLAGNIGPLTADIFCLFLKNNCEATKSYVQDPDAYSEALANIVFTAIKKRIAENIKTTTLYSEKTGIEQWAGERPYFGQDAGSWKPWLIAHGNAFRVPAPTNIDWQKQLQLTKEALSKISPKQKSAVIFWAGNPGTVTPPGQWIIYANDYMWENSIPIDKMLEVRAVLAMTITDSLIAVFDSKYTYWIRRPNMFDPSIKTVMPTPNHPSYPAGHSTISGAASTILNFYFPKNKAVWDTAAYEASMSRIWGGIHFTADHEAGLALGRNVANAALKAEEMKNEKSQHSN
ncbi:MAG: vanadium-dependent haloperoxidase [Tatlockia sp.]|nr:vanadium-dependent haloperoxidase [Tatlockia sp.]